MVNPSRLSSNALPLLLLRCDVRALLNPTLAKTTIRGTHHFLFVDYGLGECFDEVVESSKSNKWGIPSSNTLSPLSDSPMNQLENGGKVTLVGSGPGDPELLTMKAVKLLQDPNALVIVDRLVSPEIMELIQGEVKVARKLPGCAELAQEEIYWWAYQGLAAGKHVIRLKIGDPFVFGRGGEEVLKFRQYGVEAKVIPVCGKLVTIEPYGNVVFLLTHFCCIQPQGISSAFSAPLLGNIPVTHRGAANQVVMCTGYGKEGTSPDLIQYHEEQTIVFLMAVGRLRELCDRLVTMAGYPKDTPVGIVEKAGCPTQRTVVGTMETIADMAEKYNVEAPSTIVLGKVVNVLLKKDDEGVAIHGLIQSAMESESVRSN
jgi:siroheme synthase